MTAAEGLRAAIDRETARLRAEVPTDRAAALLALIRARDARAASVGTGHEPDLIFGRRLASPGANRAIHYCLETPAGTLNPAAIDDWAARFLDAADRLAAAETVLAHVATGFMRLVEEGQGRCSAWIATRLIPASWRERADLDWWAGWLVEQHGATVSEPADLQSAALMATLDYQLGYPLDAVVGGLPVRLYRDVLTRLIARALRERDPAAVVSLPEGATIAALAAALGDDRAIVARAVHCFTLNEENAAYHGASPEIAPPLIRAGPDRIVASLHGLMSEPWFFLFREIRRRDGAAYHNTALLREDAFRRDLYRLFVDKRFVVSPGRIELRRADGEARTDIDAAAFDRKTGTLGIFELKAHDPFARAGGEATRQRDNVLYANRQISGALAWIQRFGADELLRRIDARAAKTFRVHKVRPFVLGRYLVRFPDGAPPDPRAVWASWPAVLRATDGEPFQSGDANPIASLFARLSQDDASPRLPADAPARVIAFGDLRLVVHASHAALQAARQRS